MRVTQRDLRNLNPHKPAVAAMRIWSTEYAAQNEGCMDFWDSLSERRKRIARRLIERLATAPDELKE